jgi:hypothetical protein
MDKDSVTTLEEENLDLLKMVDAFGNFVRAYADGADRLLSEHTKIMQKIAEMGEARNLLIDNPQTTPDLIKAIRTELYDIGYGSPMRGDYQIGFNDALQRMDWVLERMEKQNETA